MDKLLDDVNKLILSFNRNADENTKESIRSYAESLFRSHYGDTAKQDPVFWKNKIMGKVNLAYIQVEQNYDSRSVLQCQEACTKFLGSGVISKKSEILKMMYKLSEHGNQSRIIITQALVQYLIQVSKKVMFAKMKRLLK